MQISSAAVAKFCLATLFVLVVFLDSARSGRGSAATRAANSNLRSATAAVAHSMPSPSLLPPTTAAVRMVMCGRPLISEDANDEDQDGQGTRTTMTMLTNSILEAYNEVYGETQLSMGNFVPFSISWSSIKSHALLEGEEKEETLRRDWWTPDDDDKVFLDLTEEEQDSSDLGHEQEEEENVDQTITSSARIETSRARCRGSLPSLPLLDDLHEQLEVQFCHSMLRPSTNRSTKSIQIPAQLRGRSCRDAG
jgi:hypothetical protein